MARLHVSVLLSLLLATGLGTIAALPPSWHKYIRSPATHVIKPVKVLKRTVTGGVTDAQNLVEQGHTILTRHSIIEEPPSLVVDFGRVVVGTLEIEFAGSFNYSTARPGIRLAFSETLEFLGDRSDFTRSDSARDEEKITNGTDQIAVGEAPYKWRNIRGCQFERKVCADGLHSFRYVKITLDTIRSDRPYTSLAGRVAISSVHLLSAAYLGTFESYAGWYEAPSDQRVTQWWYDGVYTAELGTGRFQSNETEPRNDGEGRLEGEFALMDGAKRDREPYAGHLAVAALTMYIAHNESEATRNVLENLAQHQTADGWIPPAAINRDKTPLFDYPLWWVVSAVNYVLYTGNISFADAYWSVMSKALDDYYPCFISNETGLLHKPADMGDYASIPRSGPITYFNALYIYALKYAAHLAISLDHSNAADRWFERANSIKGPLWRRNFDSGIGAFYDGSACPGAANDTICDVRAQDGNMLAILAGVTDFETSGRILKYWDTLDLRWGSALFDSSTFAPERFLDQSVYPFMSYFEYAARFTINMGKSARKRLGKMHSWMAEKDPGITAWEAIGANGKPWEGGYTSMAHGWSTGIVSLLTNYVLGIKPLEPGFKMWRVCPSHDIGSSKGVMPTPFGPLQVILYVNKKYRLDEKKTTVNAPYGTGGKICLPFRTKHLDASVVVNGYYVWSNRKPITYVEAEDSGMQLFLVDRENGTEYEVHLPRPEVKTITRGWNPYDPGQEKVTKRMERYVDVDVRF